MVCTVQLTVDVSWFALGGEGHWISLIFGYRVLYLQYHNDCANESDTDRAPWQRLEQH
jgi:hypothetical protein